MNPVVSNKSEENGVLKFTLSGVNLSYANAIRRIILSEIPCIVFKTTPYEQNKATIYANTTRLNNEILKQRLSCIPIHIDDLAFPIEDYILEVNEKNNTDTIKIVTSNDFKIKNIKNGKYLSKEAVSKIFPPDPISNSHIDFVRLRPKLSDDIDGEQIHLECYFSISNARDDGMFNVVSCSSFSNTIDPIAAKQAWDEKEKQLRSENQTSDDIAFIKKDWYVLEALRFFKPDSFDFIIETIGVFENEEIVKKASMIMIEKLQTFNKIIQENGRAYISHIRDTTVPECYDIKLEGEDYTLGKVVEYILYEYYYLKNKISYCSFRKPHPHISESYIRISMVSFDANSNSNSNSNAGERDSRSRSMSGGADSSDSSGKRDEPSEKVENIIMMINEITLIATDVYDKLVNSFK